MNWTQVAVTLAVFLVDVFGSDGAPLTGHRKRESGPGTLPHLVRTTLEKLHQNMDGKLANRTLAAKKSFVTDYKKNINHVKFPQFTIKSEKRRLAAILCKLCKILGDKDCIIRWCLHVPKLQSQPRPITSGDPEHLQKSRPVVDGPVGKLVGPFL